MNDILLPEV